MKTRARLSLLTIMALLTAAFSACKTRPQITLEAVDRIERRSNLPMVQPVARDLAQIRERGTLTVLAPYNSTTYFIYRGEPLGYEYELLREFAASRGLKLKMVVVTDLKSLLPLLNSGE